MGDGMREDDIYIESLLDLLNLRFSPNLEEDPKLLGGIDEIASLQKNFKIFRRGRSFSDSASILNIGGFWNARAKTRWYQVLTFMGSLESNKGRRTGDQAIVHALVTNLEGDDPSPVYFKVHKKGDDPRVLIEEAAHPLIYMSQSFLTISFPMEPVSGRRGSRRARPQRS